MFCAVDTAKAELVCVSLEQRDLKSNLGVKVKLHAVWLNYAPTKSLSFPFGRKSGKMLWR
jgi:hypothetical protein